MKIGTVALLGVGAVGAYFVEGLQEKLGAKFCVVAEGERAARLKKNGILINGKLVELNVKAPEEAAGVDLFLIAVKYGALAEAGEVARRLVRGNTTVMSLLNGVDSETLLAEKIGEEHIVPALMKVAIQRVGNEIAFKPENCAGIFFGEADGKISERIKAIAELFSGTGVRYKVSENIGRDIWAKFALNVGRNLPQAILNCGMGAYEASEHVKVLERRLRAEVVAVAAAKGIDIADSETAAGKSSKLPASARFSTLQDLDAKRETEIEMFSGALIKMAKELGVQVPFNEFAYHAIKALEEKNRGVFS